MSSSSRAVTALLDGDWRASLGDSVLFEEIWKWGFGFALAVVRFVCCRLSLVFVVCAVPLCVAFEDVTLLGEVLVRWDIHICLDIIGHRLDLMNADGWIPREQILGAEALSKVLEEFVPQHPSNGNPPILFLILHGGDHLDGENSRTEELERGRRERARGRSGGGGRSTQRAEQRESGHGCKGKQGGPRQRRGEKSEEVRERRAGSVGSAERRGAQGTDRVIGGEGGGPKVKEEELIKIYGGIFYGRFVSYGGIADGGDGFKCVKFLIMQDLNEEANRAFPDDKLLTKDGKPKEFFFSSDAQALVEHTRKVLVIEDGEVVHLKWTFLYYLSFKAFHISWLPKLCSVQGSAISSNLKPLFPAWYFAFTYFTADCIGILTDQNKLVVVVGGATALAAGVYTTRPEWSLALAEWLLWNGS
ncbi:hypothetical protein Syun_004228 [Stephania yunnanensis]|uniref:Uncharacterized protein n=1 Tax=Stephania yunnanensis TaxID=152371 RepID=A0AAP0L2R2_9MAGN